MTCPLSFSTIRSVLRQLPEQFDTLDFVALCPNSGGSKSGQGCPVVRAQGRIPCGKGIAEFARTYDAELWKLGRRSPQLWSQSSHPTRQRGKPAAPSVGPHPLAVQKGHVRTVDWMATSDFASLWSVYEEAIGRGQLYFRPTHQGVVMVVLSSQAPSLVGFRTSRNDKGYLLSRGASVQPTKQDLENRWRACMAWLPTVRRTSDEERGVATWISSSLRNNLWLPELGDGWVFLNQEWRFIADDGRAKKSDVLAVHASTGQLGIVEAKDSRTKHRDALTQLRMYRALWLRDSKTLAPFFTKVLQTQCSLYGNLPAMKTVVAQGEPRTFFAVARPDHIEFERVL